MPSPRNKSRSNKNASRRPRCCASSPKPTTKNPCMTTCSTRNSTPRNLTLVFFDTVTCVHTLEYILYKIMSYFLEDIERGLRKVDRPIVVYTHSARVNQTFCVAELLKYSVQQPSHQCLLLLTAENYAHYHLICLKQGIKLEEHIARGNLKYPPKPLIF